MRLLTANGAPLRSGSSRYCIPDLGDLGVNFTHLWDMRNAVTYTPSAAEQSDWGVSSSLRVARIPDTGTNGTFPMLRDTGPFNIYGGDGHVQPLPGPLWLPASPRFRRRPAGRFDLMAGYSEVPFAAHAVLSPQLDHANSQYYFGASGAGYDEFWMVFLFQAPGCVDSFLGSTVAGPTIGIDGSNKMTTALWTGFVPGGTVTSAASFDTSADTMGLVFYKTATGTGSIQVTVSRSANGAGVVDSAAHDVNDNPTRELFVGWTDAHYYWSCGALTTGAPSAADLTTVTNWLLNQCPHSVARTAEP